MKRKNDLSSPFVQLQWRNRVAAEYASSALAAHLLHSLIKLGVSPDLLFQCQEIVREELMHTDVSREVYLAAGGSEDAIAIHPGHLSITHAPDSSLLYRTLEFTADFFCCGETVAAPLFQRMVQKAEVSIARKSLMRIVHDEKRHGDFGWQVLTELLSLASQEDRELLKERFPLFIGRIESVYDTRTEVSASDERWGLISGREHAKIAREVAEVILRPRFESLLG